jgi:hypothetical protein
MTPSPAIIAMTASAQIIANIIASLLIPGGLLAAKKRRRTYRGKRGRPQTVDELRCSLADLCLGS